MDAADLITDGGMDLHASGIILAAEGNSLPAEFNTACKQNAVISDIDTEFSITRLGVLYLTIKKTTSNFVSLPCRS